MMFLEPFRTYGVFKSEYGPKGLFYRSVLKDSISSQSTRITNLYDLFRDRRMRGKSKIMIFNFLKVSKSNYQFFQKSNKNHKNYPESPQDTFFIFLSFFGKREFQKLLSRFTDLNEKKPKTFFLKALNARNS